MSLHTCSRCYQGALLLLVSSFANWVHADTAQIAVAANFAAPMKLIAAEFTRTTGHHLQISYGATGKLYTQIKNGAPYEALLTADHTTATQLINEGAAVAGTQFTYATGRLVLWSPQPNVVDERGAVLKQNQFNKLAIANPKLAPYGAAAIEVLKVMGVLTAVQSKLVTGENIAQTFQFVTSGNAELGFIALSQIMKNGKITTGSAWIVPDWIHAPIRQDAVVLTNGKDSAAVAALMTFLKSESTQALVKQFGYTF